MATTSTLITGTSTPASGAGISPLNFQEEPAGGGIRQLLKVFSRRRRIFLITAATVTLASALVTVARRYTHPVYQGGFTFLISDPVNPVSGGDQEGGNVGAVARNVTRIDVPTLIRVLESPKVLEPVYSQLRQRFPDRPLPSIDVTLQAADPGGQREILAAGVLGVSSRGGDRDMLREALELTQKTYLEWALLQRREKLTEGVKFLEQQEPGLQAKVSGLQNELQAFRQSNNVLDPAQNAATVREQADSLRDKLITQQTERQRLLQLRGDVAAGRLATRSFGTTAGEEGGTSLSLDLPNQSQLEQLTALEAQIAEAQTKYQPDAPLLRNLIASRNKLRPALQAKEIQAIDAAIEQLDVSMTGTRQQLGRLEGSFQNQPALMRQYEDLQRRLESAQNNLTSYLRTKDQFQLEIAQNNVPWKLLSTASVSETPVEPTLSKGLLQGLLLGLVAGGGAALLRDRLDHVFHSSMEVRDELKVPLLGHVPHISFFTGVKREKRFLLQELDAEKSGLGGYQRFAYQEAFRNLYTSLRFLQSGRPVRSVAVSSSIPSEGKSLVIVLLAKTLSELGQRVLLVDADLRQPQIHSRLGLDNLQGLSSLLTEGERNWRDVLQTMPDYPNWDVITAGRQVPDPPRLLGSPRMGEIIRDISESGGYDLILYDTPPTLGLADASLLAESLDGILLVVGLGKVDRDLPAEAIRRIESAGAPLLGVVSNAFQASPDASTPYGYGAKGSGSGTYGDSLPAHDPSLAYSYYTQTGEKDRVGPGGWRAFLPTPQNFKRWNVSVRRWMDGSE